MSSPKLLKKSFVTAVAAISLPVMSLGFSNLALAESDVSITGNIGVFSNYVLRGIRKGGGENSGAALQGGFDLSHSSGIYIGYWGSNLGYSDTVGESGFENDIYLGYSGETAGVSYSAGVVYYKYLNISDFDTPEANVNIGYGPVNLDVKYLLTDVGWGNAGDTYITLNADTDLPMDFNVGVSAGFYKYVDSGEFIKSSKIDSGFRHLNITLSHPIGKTGADMSLTGIYGGVDRDDVDQGVTGVFGITYGFDI